MSHLFKASVLLTALALGAVATAKEPLHRGLLGTWEIDPSGSLYKGRAPLKGRTMRFEATPDGIHVVCDVMTASGIPFHFEYQGPEDGSIHPVNGNPQRSAPEDGHLYTSTIVWKRKAGS